MSCNNGSQFVGHWDIEGIPQGSDSEIRVTYKPNGVVADLSTYSAKLQVRRDYGMPVLIELSTTDGSIELDAVAPNVILNFTVAKTASLTVYEGMIYDLELTASDNTETRILEGSFSVSRPVTT